MRMGKMLCCAFAVMVVALSSLAANNSAFGASIEITYPRDQDVWYAGNNYLISCQTTGLGTQLLNVKLFKGSSEIKILGTANASACGLQWTVPDSPDIPPGIDYKIGIMTSTNNPIDMNQFSIKLPFINITDVGETGGKLCRGGKDNTVRWTSGGVTGNVDIELLKDGSVLKKLGIKDALGGSFTFKLDVPDGSGYGIQIVGKVAGNNVIGKNIGNLTVSDCSAIAQPVLIGEFWICPSGYHIRGGSVREVRNDKSAIPADASGEVLYPSGAPAGARVICEK